MSSAAPKEAKIQTKVVPSILRVGAPPEGGVALPKATQDFGAYKRSSLAARYWGGIAPCEQPLRHVGAEEAQETFLKGLLATPTDAPRKNPAELFFSLVVHVVVVGTIVVAPLLFTQAIDISKLQATYLTMPKPPAAPAPPAPAIQTPPARTFRSLHPALLTTPNLIPKKIVEIKDAEAPDIGTGGVVGGEPGGVLGGVLGGIQGGPPALPAPPPPPAKKIVYRVGGNVKAPRELSRVEPAYPVIARTAHVEGTVIVSAIIDENGDVVQAKALSGPGLLMPAAVQAVLKWKYEPSSLNGTPVSVSMEVQVNFRLR